MSEHDPRDDDALPEGKASLLVRVQRAVRSSTGRTVEARDGLIERVRDRVEQTVAPAIEEAAKKMLLKLAEPENAQRLQETLAGFAQFAMKSGFRSDPNAGLLFDFVDHLEKRHSRQQVLEVVVQHAIVYEQDLLATITEAVQSGADLSSLGAERFDAFRDRASTRLLTLLCSLAALDSDEPAPNSHHDPSHDKPARDEKIAYFEKAPIEERFKPLARMAAGEKEAFAGADHSPKDSAKETPGLVRRAVNRLAGDRSSGKPSSGKRSSALARFVPSLGDPATRFLTTSYLFFMQSYLVRAMIEQLPEMLATVRDLEHDVRAQQDDAEVIEVGD